MSLTYGFCLDGLDSTYDSAQFSDAFHALTGDGLTRYGARFALTINGFTATASSGYALASGRWLKNDEPLALTIQPSGSHADRTDALVIRVDYEARTVSLEVMTDVDPSTLGSEPSLLTLYLLRVRRGAAALTPEDVTDVRIDSGLCGEVVPLREISEDVLFVYDFLRSGIDQEVARLLGLSEQVVQKAEEAIAGLDAAIAQAGGSAEIGELLLSLRHPVPEEEWLLCDGSGVPEEYPDLQEMLEGTLPEIPPQQERFMTFIYGGVPVRRD